MSDEARRIWAAGGVGPGLSSLVNEVKTTLDVEVEARRIWAAGGVGPGLTQPWK